MVGLKEKVISKIVKLPESRIFEVMDFIDFVTEKEETEAWNETNEILRNKKLMKAIKEAEMDIKSGRIYSWEKVRK